MQYAEYMKAAIDAVNHVDALNYLSNNRGPLLDGLDASTASALTVPMMRKYGRYQMAMYEHVGRDDGDAQLAIDNLLAPVASARALRTASCEARAGMAFLYLARRGIQPIEMMSFANDDADHVFVLVNRQPGFRITDSATWGDEAIVCDPWARSCYAAPMMAAQLALPIYANVVGRMPYTFTQSCEYTGGAWPPARLAEVCRVFGV